ncbi:aldehyde dehydrogenase family protein [Burkholderia gladioli]|uniref:aldehyde dehydrogenase family protein n=1 Tax=Burkholderia gladioli TaxID=28095 RepID=UPI001ABA19DA|nr:aldehyde dehydrogenase family protein [Burkholderia gladioli]MDA0575943.1 aldehyde dehydrogenase family protein [Burkholderia gladioli]MDA0602752.1 aldehyde dehydrogenase family protein [Burkholderia gladioli]
MNATPLAAREVREGMLFIDGHWTAGSEREVRPDFNPATGELFAQVHQATRADAIRAIDAAHRARDDSANLLVGRRAEILLSCADALAAMADEVRDVLRSRNRARPTRRRCSR